MNVLIVAPDQPDLNLLTEIRDIQKHHNVQLLNGHVTKKELYTWVREGRYNILHFAGHGGEPGFALSDGDVLTQEEIGQLCRVSQTLGVVLNACNMVKVATYLVLHGAEVVVFASVAIPDDEAWQMPSVFYRLLQDGTPADVVTAYKQANDSTGIYSILIAPSYVERLLATIKELTARIVQFESTTIQHLTVFPSIKKNDLLVWLIIWLTLFGSILLVLSRVIKLW